MRTELLSDMSLIAETDERSERESMVAAARVPEKILLLDGYSTRTLACVRSWGRRGVRFAVAGETRWDMSLCSRYAKETGTYTSPKRDAGQFIADVNRLCRDLGADHVFPTSEAGIMACSQREEELIATPIIPRRDELEASFSKMNTLRLAQTVGVHVPETLYLTRENSTIPRHLSLRFPVVVKSESSEVMQQGKAVTSGKTYYAQNRGELERECAARLSQGQSVLVQEFIDGYGIGVSGLFRKGAPVALIGHRRIRESNPMGGPSAVAETIAIEAGLLKSTSALVSRIGMTGPAMVEYKVDRRDGRAYLMEINGRFWGSILLALAAGLDLPYLYWKMLQGVAIGDEEKKYRIGVRGRNLVGDTKCLLVCMKGRPQGWPGELPTRGNAIKEYCRSFVDRRSTELLLAGDDPLPFFARLVQPNS